MNRALEIGREAVPASLRSMAAGAVGEIAAHEEGVAALVLMARSNFQSRNGGCGKRNTSIMLRAVFGAGLGLPGRAMGRMSISLRARVRGVDRADEAGGVERAGESDVGVGAAR